jgi:hypothetical protein
MKETLMNFKLKRRERIMEERKQNYEALSDQHKKIITKDYQPSSGDKVTVFMQTKGPKGTYLKKIISGVISCVRKDSVTVFDQPIKGGDYTELQFFFQPRIFFKLELRSKKRVNRKKSSVGIHLGR